MSKTRVRNYSALGALALFAALGLGAAWQRNGAIGEEPRKEIDPAAVRHAQELSDAFSGAAEVAMPSVVTIRSKTKAHALARKGGNATPKLPRGENPFKGTPFEDLYNGGGLQDMPQATPRREGMGSGVIIDPKGLVLTNNHVVEGADEVTVHLADGREFKGQDIKTDEETDLAVIRISGAGTLPAAKLGNSDKMKIGDWVIAIGNPFGFEQTVSAGIISGLGRELNGESARRARFLQTDAAINPGNSGGPLVNLRGEVVGINTAIATATGSFNGLGFAIPVNEAKWVTNQLVQQGSVQRAYLGVALNEMTPDLAEKFGAHLGEGVLIAQVMPNTPAAKAGFETGDVITKFGGERVTDRSQLQSLVERVPVNAPQEVEVLRNGKPHTLRVTPAAKPKDLAAVEPSRRRSAPSTDSGSYAADELGIEVSELTVEQARQLGYEGESGVLVTKVDPDKPAGEEGLREGMLILRVGKKTVKSVSDFQTALKDESLQQGVLLLVRSRTGGNHFLLLKG